ncbi:GNAT family N-acetyltransferase [Flavobacterium sedimenticola]|uniref:GNAT family N-acetyltransferase n=1 Tax=Flavobacterium sedimenticola TaxID=3043286 RepID=A0ABT6XT46_9FLAO|nr:GNAT family N-acetyltransferase [Flavobacterium sedimenticola]MDI9258157.1 GNAT family N-acetyltransferase [Flavobacterium sedimenticola]
MLPVSQSITLRPIQLQDSAVIYKTIMRQREYLGKWLPFVAHTHTEQDTLNFITSVISRPAAQWEPFFVIEFEGQFCGLINCKNTDFINKKTEIGYWLSKDFQKQGIMIQSLQALTHYVFAEFGMNRIVIKCAVENEPSQNVALKAGYKWEGIEREGEQISALAYRDLQVFSLLKKDLHAKPILKKTKPGINHIELWVADLDTSVSFYREILNTIGWVQINPTAFATETMEVYLKEMPPLTTTNSLGVRHICFQATEKKQVDKVAKFLVSEQAVIIRGPIQMNYSEGYYTVDFYDPDGLIVEVAYTPNMKFLN